MLMLQLGFLHWLLSEVLYFFSRSLANQGKGGVTKLDIEM